MPKRVSFGIVGVAKETTPYVFGEPAAADAFFAREISIDYPEGEPIRRNDTRTHYGKSDNVPNPVGSCEIGFTIDLLGASAAGTAPYYRKSMLGVGFREDKVTSTDVKYRPFNTFDNATAAGPPITENPYQSVSACIWEDGERYSLAGGAGNLTVSAKSGQTVEGKFSFRGAYVAVTDDTNPSPVTPSAIIPPTFVSATLSVHGVGSLVFESFELDFGGVLTQLVDANHAQGLKGFWISDRRITLRINPDMVSTSTIDFFGKWRSQATGAFTWGAIGSGAGNRLSFNASRVQLGIPKPGVRDAGRIVEIPIDVVTLFSAAEGDDCYLQWT